MADRYIYSLHANMMRRCYNTQYARYSYWGGRGVRVYPGWHDSKNFYKFIKNHLGERPDPSYSLDRIDNNGNYEPGNVRWATSSQQNLNKRKHKYSSKFVTIDDSTKPLAHWIRERRLNPNTVYSRINLLNWPPDRALELTKGRI